MATGDHTPEELFDPLQGFDIKVQVNSYTATGIGTARLIGAFTSLMFKIVNQTETYLPLNSRIPRMLDGEMIVVWSMEQGLVDLDVVGNTFGKPVKDEFLRGRQGLIPRQTRFSISFQTNMAAADITNIADSDVGFRQSSGFKANANNKTVFRLEHCRVDTQNFGVAAGRHIVATTWQGTAQNMGLIGITA